MGDGIEALWAIGLMSGTSRDGIDVAMIETDGRRLVRPIAFASHEYDAATRQLIAAACDVAMHAVAPQYDKLVADCEHRLTGLHMALVEDLLRRTSTAASSVDVIGFHGHTVAHRADRGWTWQIGDAQQVADRFALPVVGDLRRDDMTGGGQGAPLLPVYHRSLFSDPSRNVAVLNLGGVANLTWLGREGGICAFDCGMANALIDDWVAAHCHLPYDAQGAIAATGAVHQHLVDAMLVHPFFTAPYPKSLDRADFGNALIADLSAADGAATLTAFTAQAVAIALRQLPGAVDRLIVTGGGRKNATMMRMINAASGITPQPTEAFGWDGDAIEAQGFAYMAVRRLKALPITFPETTGVAAPMIGGTIVEPRSVGERSAA